MAEPKYMAIVFARPEVQCHVDAARRHVAAGQWKLAADEVYIASAKTMRPRGDGGMGVVPAKVAQHVCRASSGKVDRRAKAKLSEALRVICAGRYDRWEPRWRRREYKRHHPWMESVFAMNKGSAGTRVAYDAEIAGVRHEVAKLSSCISWGTVLSVPTGRTTETAARQDFSLYTTTWRALAIAQLDRWDGVYAPTEKQIASKIAQLRSETQSGKGAR